MKPALWDMHVHLDFISNVPEVIRDAEAAGLGMLAVTVTPQGYKQAGQTFPGSPNVRLCPGLHPWWTADGRCGPEDAVRTAELVRDSRYVGEIGLDFSPKHVSEGSRERQSAALEMICAACAESSSPAVPKILSLHAVKAAGAVLDILSRTGCLERCRCIFHWFTGSNEELTRAVRAGCMFSVNGMMLSTRRGREYARQIPAGRLLLETDLPPGEGVPFSAGKIIEALEQTLSELSAIRGTDLRETILHNSEELLNI